MRVWEAPWGLGRGALRHLAPESRLIFGAGAVVTCLVTDPLTWNGVGLLVGTLLLVSLLAFAPARVLGKSLALGLVMLGPVFVLSPFSTAEMPDSSIAVLAPVAAPFRVFVRGVCVLIVTGQIVSSLTRSDLREALARLPVPTTLSAVVQQVLLQADLQVKEVERIGLAMRARGATRGTRNRLRVAFGMPKVWLGRLLFRAQRNARAMEARGYAGQPLAFHTYRWRAWDLVSLVGAIAWCVVALWLRWGRVA